MSTFEALLSGGSWNGEGVTGRPAFITFSFETAAAPYMAEQFSATFLATFQPFTAAEEALARQALKAWADASGIVFIEVPAGQGDIRFGEYDFSAGPKENQDAAAFAFSPSRWVDDFYAAEWLGGGDVFVDRGSATFDILLHEIGHAIGLKHPFEGDPILDPAMDRVSNTVMSYENVRATGLGTLDLAAVQHIYGGSSADGAQTASWSWDAAALRLTQTGGALSDTLIGVGSADLLVGGAGNDRLYGADGADSLDGGDGDDALSGGDGLDTLMGGAGDDFLEGGGGLDVLDSGLGDDILMFFAGGGVADGGAGNDALYVLGGDGGVLMDYGSFTAGGGSYANIEWFGLIGGLGNDTLVGGWRDDELYAGGGDDSITGGDDWDLITGDEGRDTVYGGSADDWIEGNDGDDFLRGDAGDDELWGDEGFDDTHGNIGNDTVHGGGGPDSVVGGQGNDVLFGDDDHDVVYGNLGNDTQYGGVGSDWVRGGQGDDSIVAEAGDDFIAGDRGADTLVGGAGADRFHSFAEAGSDRIEDFNLAQGDRLNLLVGATYTVAQAGLDTVVTIDGAAQVTLVGVQASSLGGDWVTFG